MHLTSNRLGLQYRSHQHLWKCYPSSDPNVLALKMTSSALWSPLFDFLPLDNRHANRVIRWTPARRNVTSAPKCPFSSIKDPCGRILWIFFLHWERFRVNLLALSWCSLFLNTITGEHRTSACSSHTSNKRQIHSGRTCTDFRYRNGSSVHHGTPIYPRLATAHPEDSQTS